MIPRSLRARVTAVGVVTLALVLGIGAWVTVRALAGELRSDINAQNEEVLDALATEIMDGTPVSSLALPIGADGTEFLILGSAGEVLNVSLPPADDGSFPFLVYESGPFLVDFTDPSELDDLQGIQIQGEEIFFEEGYFDNFELLPEDWFNTTRNVASPNDGSLTLIASSPFGIVDRSIDRLALALTVIVPLLVVAGGFALWAATGAALRPVQRIAEEADRIAPSNSGDRLPVPATGDEIAKLTTTLNGMLDRLDDGLIRQRQFLSDASHELRSPLTSIKGASELVAGGEDLPDGLARNIAVVRRGAARLEAVLDDVTQLAEGDGDLLTAEVDLDVLIKREIDLVAGELTTVEIDASAVSPMVVMANDLQLGRAVNNLLTNATRHARHRVAIGARRADSMVEITVDDDGPGIPAADRVRIFERFVRLDDGRDRATGGSGLGLAIVAAIAKAHGGSVGCESGPSGGARMWLRIPAGRAASDAVTARPGSRAARS